MKKFQVEIPVLEIQLKYLVTYCNKKLKGCLKFEDIVKNATKMMQHDLEEILSGRWQNKL